MVLDVQPQKITETMLFNSIEAIEQLSCVWIIVIHNPICAVI